MPKSGFWCVKSFIVSKIQYYLNFRWVNLTRLLGNKPRCWYACPPFLICL